jgi:uncharacterized membrane protein YraQ (UPF0718 family)
MRTLKKYGFFAAVLILNLVALMFFPQAENRSLAFIWNNFQSFLITLAPVFICVGLLDVWVEKEAMLKIMGEKSGGRGVLVSFLLGVVTAVPLYALLPIAGMLLKKGSKISNVLVFICSCTSIRIPLLLFEVSSLGWKFTAVRFFANLVIVVMIAFGIDRILTEKDKRKIYDSASTL